ncbi:DUF4232 domain-containing protein [Streptomyces sp. NPDC001219]
MRTIRSRTAAAAVAVVLAGLSLTACDGDTEAASGAPSSAGSGSDTTGGSGGENGTSGASGTSGKGEGSGSGQGSSGGKGGSSGKTGGTGKGGGTANSASDACTGDNVKTTVSKVTRPLNHVLIKITNSGSQACNAYGAPLLGFDGDQAATRIIEDSKPQSVLSVAPGSSAYASVALTGEPGESTGGTVKQLTVHFAPRSGSGSVGSPAKLALPAGTHKDDNASVTYWQSSASDALTY